MNTCFRPASLILLIVALLAADGVLYRLTGNIELSGWTGTVVRNWNQFGIRALKGKAVTNPGGFEALSKPEIYKGHRAASMYPVFAVDELFLWTGDGLLCFNLFFNLVLFLAIWHLLGRGQTATLIAASALLCPGCTVYPAHVDPNAISLYMVVPFAAFLLPLMADTTFSSWRAAIVFCLTFAYTSLNWTTLFGHGILFAYFFSARNVPRRNLIIYTVFAGVSIALIAGVSVLDKIGYGSGSGEKTSLIRFLGGYTWAPWGYGTGMGTGKALVRLLAANLMGLLPLILAGGYLLVKQRKLMNFAYGGLVALPFVMAVLGVAAMRNYFGHHPWMAAPMLFPGLILSLALLPRQKSNADLQKMPAPTVPRRIPSALFLMACFAYAVVVLGAYRAYHSEPLALLSLLRLHTDRSDTIFVIKSLDPQMADQAGSIEVSADRRVRVLDNLTDWQNSSNRAFVLSAAGVEGKLPLLARSEKTDMLSWPIVRELTAAYAKYIARRRPEDKHFDYAAGETFGLYRLNSGSN